MPLTRYGLREWLVITVVAAAVAVVMLVLGWWWAAVAVAAAWVAVVSFFRDPIRRIDAALPWGVFLSPADGKVSAVVTVEHHEATGGPAVIVRIFLSLLNVHVNRAAHDGKVVALKHTPGKFLAAYTEESSVVNESNLITFDFPPTPTSAATSEAAGSGEALRFGIRQVAGKAARRIVCPLRVGDVVVRGGKFGMIKFGSTTELILPHPDRVTVHVKKGDRVRGGLTVLATMR